MKRKITDFSDGWTFRMPNGEKRPISIRGGWLKQGIDCEYGTYEKTFQITEEMRRGELLLHLEAVNHLAMISIVKDGHKIPVHEEVTAFTGQTAVLTPYLDSADELGLEIFVRAFQDGRPIAPHAAEWCESIARGIFRGISIEIRPRVSIEDLRIKTSVRRKELTYLITVRNTTAEKAEGKIRLSLAPFWNSDWNYPDLEELPFEAEACGVTAIQGKAAWNLSEESFWRPNVPYRKGYQAELHILRACLCLGTAGEKEDETEVRFGFRELTQEGSSFFLNGVKLNFRGDSLQTANYDRIDRGGKGDAIGTLGGFLPPSGDNPGWPAAVDHFLRLNMNVQRMHMAPWTPYMIDVCDEMGLMLIGESACRWDGFDMEDGRGNYEVTCLGDMVKRDRNHPSIVRWCLKNEPQCADPAYHEELYNAVKALDDTRPLYEEFITGDRNSFNPENIFCRLLEKKDFTWMEHYLSYDETGNCIFSTTKYNDALIPMESRPFGITESNFVHSSTPQGLVWFATSAALLRGQGAADIRPYTLLSSWCACIPGINNYEMRTEENRIPLYGENNLPNPWENEGIQLYQSAFHPFLAMDGEYWKLNKEGDCMGHFPCRFPVYPSGSRIERTITMFNDSLRKEELELYWQVREGSFVNTGYQEGREVRTIFPGERETVPIAFASPKMETNIFLTFQVICRGNTVYEDSRTCFCLKGGEEYRGDYEMAERVFR